jgi:hypothetical protein
VQFPSNCIYVLELEKCDTQTPSTQSPVCSGGSRNQNTSHIPPLGGSSKLRHIQVFTYSCSVISQWNIKVDIQTGIICKHLWYKWMLWLTLPSICNASNVCENCWGILAIFLYVDLGVHGHFSFVHCFPSIICSEILKFLVHCDNIVAYLHHIRIVTSKHAPAITQ